MSCWYKTKKLKKKKKIKDGHCMFPFPFSIENTIYIELQDKCPLQRLVQFDSTKQKNLHASSIFFPQGQIRNTTIELPTLKLYSLMLGIYNFKVINIFITKEDVLKLLKNADKHAQLLQYARNHLEVFTIRSMKNVMMLEMINSGLFL